MLRLVPLALLLLPALAAAEPAVVPTSQNFDLDGDGKSDGTVALDEKGNLAVVSPTLGSFPVDERWLRTEVAGPYSTLELSDEYGKVHGVLVIRATQVGREAEGPVSLVFAGGPIAAFAGRLGPQGVDGDWSLHLGEIDGVLHLWAERPDHRGCDGRVLRLDRRRLYQGRFVDAILAPPFDVAAAARLAPTAAPPADVLAAPAPMVFRFEIATAQGQAGLDGGVEDLDAPRELDDGDVKTTWRAGTTYAALSLVARSSSRRFPVRALRVVSGARELLVSTGKATFAVKIPVPPRTGPVGQYVVFPEPPVTTCLEVVTTGAPIAELQILTDLELGGAAALAALAEEVAGGSRDSERILTSAGPAGVAALVAAAGKERPDEGRRRLVAALARTRSSAATPILLEGLAAAASGAEVEELVAALTVLGTDRTPALVRLLDEPATAASVRLVAVARLAGVPGSAPAPALRRAAGKGGAKLRALVARALGGRDPAELDALRLEAEAAFAAGDEPRAADLLRATAQLAARHPDAATRAAVAVALAAQLDQARSYELRHRLAVGLAGLAAEEPAATALASFLAAEKEPALRAVTVRAISGGGPVGLALAALGDGDPGVRAAALEALGADRGDDSLLAARLGEDGWPLVREAAAVALGGRCGRAAAGDALVGAAGRDRSDDVRRAALDGLASCREPRLPGLLMVLARDARVAGAVRVHAAALAGRMGDGALVSPLVDLLGDARLAAMVDAGAVKVAAAAAYSLGQLRDPRGVAVLLDAAGDSSFAEVQAAALVGLSLMCPLAARPVATRAEAESTHPAVTRAARRLLDCFDVETSETKSE